MAVMMCSCDLLGLYIFSTVTAVSLAVTSSGAFVTVTKDDVFVTVCCKQFCHNSGTVGTMVHLIMLCRHLWLFIPPSPTLQKGTGRNWLYLQMFMACLK